MTSCLPRSLDDILPTLNACARAAGGADWVSDAILGAQALALLVFVVLAVGAVVVRVGR